MQSAGRDEKRLETETQSESKSTSNENLKLELVRRALLYRESATAVVVLLVESDLQEHANGRRKRRTSSVPSAVHSSSTCTRLHKTRACDNIAYIRISAHSKYIFARSKHIKRTNEEVSGLRRMVLSGDAPLDGHLFGWTFLSDPLIQAGAYNSFARCSPIPRIKPPAFLLPPIPPPPPQMRPQRPPLQLTSVAPRNSRVTGSCSTSRPA